MLRRIRYEQSTLNSLVCKIIYRDFEALVKESPFLSISPLYTPKEFEKFFLKQQQFMLDTYSESSYKEIQEILQNRRLNPDHHQQIKTKIADINQSITKRYEGIKQLYEESYQDNYKLYRRNPIKNKRPGKKDYQVPPFSVSESPYTLENFYKYSALVFETLDQKKQIENIQNKDYKLEADHQRERQLIELEKKSVAYRQEQKELEQQGDRIQRKKALLKRKMEQLKHLTRISNGYNQLPDQDDLTTPETQINALVQLLNQKRRK